MKKKKFMISQPMRGLSDEQILEVREKALKWLDANGYELVDTFFQGQWADKELLENEDVRQVPILFLAKSISKMAYCDGVYFCNGWINARGCVMEHNIAESYGLEIIHQSDIQ